MLTKLSRSITQSFQGAGQVVRRGFKVLMSDPHIMTYPYFAVAFIALSSPLVTKFILSSWDKVSHPAVISQVGATAPHALQSRLGLVAFSVFYTLFVTSYFVCAISAETMARLEGKDTLPLYGFKVVGKKFLRVTKFALLSVFFLPLGIFTQYRKLSRPKGIIDVLGSSFSLNMAQLAPAILNENKGVSGTIRQTVNTLGHAWRESLIIRIGLFIWVALLASISFLPQFIGYYWFDGKTAHFISWLLTALLGITGYVVFRVIGAVFTTTLYHHAKTKN